MKRFFMYIAVAALASVTAPAQRPVRVPIAATFGPAHVSSGQTFRLCVMNIFSNSMLNAELPTAPLQVKIAFIDAISGRLLEPIRDAALKMPEGACFAYQPPPEQTETMVFGAVVPMSSQDSRSPSAELLPIASALVMNGSGANARAAYVVPLVPKVNLLVPGR